MPTTLLFDLDGTVVDSIQLILGAGRHAFADFAGTRPSDEEWRATIGRPLLTVLREYAGSDDEANRLFERYREYQLEHHDRLVSAYPGMVSALRAFHAAGHPLAIVTSKSDWLARRALEHVGVSDLFPVLVGCDTCVNHKPHPEPVERALAQLGASADDAVFIGDSPHDVLSGRAAGVATIGVTWGAFAREGMVACGADRVIDNVTQLTGAVAELSTRRPVQTF